jgi:hypothetical protein
MFRHNFWIISIIVKLILFGALTYYVNKVKNCIDSADASGIKENFKAVEITTYVIVLFNYGLFALKYINPVNDKKNVSAQPQTCGLSYVNLSLVLVLLSFVWQTKSALLVAEKNPVPISFLADNFKLTENISYILLIFNILTSGIIFLFNNKKNESGSSKINISPRSKNY